MKTAELQGIKKNVLGTISIDLKIQGMRKAQDFIFYPINKDTKSLTIQSNTRIAVLNLDGIGKVSNAHQNGAYFHHLQMDTLTHFEFNKSDWQQIIDYIGLTDSKEAGKKENGVIHSDNSGAKSIFNL
jgi:hypothetical protein